MSVIEFSDVCICGVNPTHGAVGKNIIPSMITFANDSHNYASHLPTMYENSFYF